MVTLKSAYKYCVNTLENAGVETAYFEAACLFEKAFGMKYHSTEFEACRDKTINYMAYAILESMLIRRLGGEPLQYIVGLWEFYGLPFYVGDGCLCPRQDTETLVETVVNKCRVKNPIVIDLCAGTGCVGIALEKELNSSELYSVEISPCTAQYLEKNAQLNNSAMIMAVEDCLDEACRDSLPCTDVLVCNPPYLTAEDMKNLQTEVTFEPEQALYGGEDGLDFYRNIIMLWKNRLNDNGIIAFEVGAGQDKDVAQMLIQHGFKDVRRQVDLCGINRVVYGFYEE